MAGLSDIEWTDATWNPVTGCTMISPGCTNCYAMRMAARLQAIRDNEVAAASQGIAVGRMKLAVYVVAALGCGLAGALYFVGNVRISPDAAFGINWTAFAIFIAVIGAVIFWLLNKFVADYGTWYQLGLGVLAKGP